MDVKPPKDPLFIYADNLVRDGKWLTPTVTIEHVHLKGTVQGADKRLVDKPCVKFKGSDKMLVLNATNESLLRLQFGSSDYKQWEGQKIVLEPRMIAEAFGERDVPVIRVLLPDDIPVPFRLRKHIGKRLTGNVTKEN